MGKTRFSLHLAARARTIGVAHIRQVRLSDLTDSREVQPRFLATTRAADLETFAKSLQGRSALVIFDNCEHVLAGVQEIIPQILESCPSVKVICTTRESLLLPGETVFELEPLGLPDAALSSEEVAAHPPGAIQLFLDRYAEMASEELDLLAEMPRIRALVGLVDGLPLAIEQAAFQASLLGVAACLDSLRQSLPALSSERAHYEPRHRTIAATMQWSYDLLDEEEKRDLHAAASFICPFDARDLAAMLGVENAASRLGNLYRKSLVQREAVIGGHRMFRIIEVIAEFVRTHPDRPELDPGLPESWLKHIEFMAFEVSPARLFESKEYDFEQVRPRMPMIDRTVRHLALTEPERGRDALYSLTRAYFSQGHYGYVEKTTELLLAYFADSEPRLVLTKALCLSLAQRFEEALPILDRGIELAEAKGDIDELIRAYQYKGSILSDVDRLSEAVAATEKGFDLVCELGLTNRMRTVGSLHARLLLDDGQPEEARRVMEIAHADTPLSAEYSGSAQVIFAEIYYELKDLPQMGAALRDGLSVVEADTVEDQMPGLILRSAVYLALIGQWQDACRAYGGAKEGYNVLGMMVVAAKKYESIYFDLVQDLPEPDRLRWELEGAVSPPRTWCRHARAAIERMLQENPA